jgi:epsin
VSVALDFPIYTIANRIPVDDFDDFQSAPSPTTTAPVPTQSLMAATAAAALTPVGKPAGNVFDLLNATPVAPAPATTAGRPLMGYGVGSSITPSPVPTFAPMKPATPAATTVSAVPAKATSGGGFDDLWTMSLGGSKPSTPVAGSTTGKTIQDIQREKASQAFWGAGTGVRKPGSGSTGGGAFAASSGADDLLL